MSFLDEEARGKASNSREGGAFDQLFADFTHSINLLRKRCAVLGTKKDSQEVRYSIETEIIPHCETIRDQIETKMSGVDMNGKLVKDFVSLKEELLRGRRHYNELKNKYPIRKLQRADSNTTNTTFQQSGYVSMPLAHNDESTPLLQGQQQLQQQQIQSQIPQSTVTQDELNFHSLIQEERSQEISRIHSAVQEVNAIFHQLGSLVREQGEEVDTIDNNISGLAGNLQRANDQLSKAEHSQRKRNRCGMVTLVIIVVVALVVLLAALS
ncbi:LAFE_0F06546g1_1 [Lachancea fermentati]|uniref:LAFE_0F06546g1_1 n=1 Tax=Lachancea fermentati TaxID=4955 RepID=A0A1G4MF07_LACFM|nr:LAFE_0F06546g1_1 [Lachancea fermentati]